MPEVITSVLAVPGLEWLIGAVFVAGLVRGFAGFGTGMIYLPVAGQWLGPFEAITTLIAMDLIGPLPNIPRALRDGNRPDVARLGLGMLAALPVGVFILTLVEPDIFRYGVSMITAVLLVLLIYGVRYSGILTPPLVFGTGAAGGFLGGAVGLPGPPVIMLYMASENPSQVIRANITIYLLITDVALTVMFWLFGQLDGTAFLLGLGLALPYLTGNVLGAAMFRLQAERGYRFVAYLVIAASALSGLPIFD